MKKLFLFIPSLVISFFSVSYIPGEKDHKNKVAQDSLVIITVTAVGDIMCHSVQYNYAMVTKDSFDFKPVYREVKKYLTEADFAFGNLETVSAGKEKGYSGYPFFNTPDDFIPALKDAGFDLITTANNHSLDRGEHGVLRTIEQLNINNIPYNGTFTSSADRDSIRIFNIRGIRAAFLSYTYGTNGNPIPKGKSYLVNMIDYSLIEKDIRAARENGAELVLVHYHFGEEYKREPAKSQLHAVNKAIELGADIIIGGHPHVIQPADFFAAAPDARLDTGFVAYSLGNFISNQRWRYSDAGIILNLEITKNLLTDSLYISQVSFIPTWVFKGQTERGREYIILPAEGSYSYLTNNETFLMKQALDDTQKIMNKYSKEIKIKSIAESSVLRK